MDRQYLFTNLVNLAAVDGKFTEEEVQFLVDRAERWGIATEEFETALAGVGEEIALRLPAEKAERIELLAEMIRLMAADGELAETEKGLCAAASASMEITSEEFAALVDSLIRP
jgi:uncharacterized tellurite resistance protein B-like protein